MQEVDDEDMIHLIVQSKSRETLENLLNTFSFADNVVGPERSPSGTWEMILFNEPGERRTIMGWANYYYPSYQFSGIKVWETDDLHAHNLLGIMDQF